MAFKMKCEDRCLNINSLHGHASSPGYRSPLLFFTGLIHERQIRLAACRFCTYTSFLFIFGRQFSVPGLKYATLYFKGLIFFFNTPVTHLMK